MGTKILLDTDIGSDIDDAVCLAYLLANPACELLGITTVSGDTVARASLASVLCKIAGKTIPIHPGAMRPLVGAPKKVLVPHAEALSRWDHKTEFSRGEAVEFMLRTIRANPGEITLLGIGPMTNLAALFAADEDVASLLKGIVLMGGIFKSRARQREWNAWADPVATAMVYQARTPVHRSIGLDVTYQVTMPPDDVRQRFQHPLLLPVKDFAEEWFTRQPRINFHDPLAAATIFDETLCGFERGRVEVELKSDQVPGATYWEPKADGPHEVAVTVEPQRFFDHYFGMFE